jgi:hypothetical protein
MQKQHSISNHEELVSAICRLEGFYFAKSLSLFSRCYSGSYSSKIKHLGNGYTIRSIGASAFSLRLVTSICFFVFGYLLIENLFNTIGSNAFVIAVSAIIVLLWAYTVFLSLGFVVWTQVVVGSKEVVVSTKFVGVSIGTDRVFSCGDCVLVRATIRYLDSKDDIERDIVLLKCSESVPVVVCLGGVDGEALVLDEVGSYLNLEVLDSRLVFMANRLLRVV